MKRVAYSLLGLVVAGLGLTLFHCLSSSAGHGVVFRSVSLMRMQPVTDTDLRNKILIEFGNEANQLANYPASFTAVFNAQCSATLIGKDTVLTSAHCADLAAEQTIHLEINGDTIPAVCNPHPGFDELTKANDIALCKLQRPAPGSQFENIADDTQGQLVPTGAAVRITGWADPEPASAFERWWRRLRRCLGFGSAFKVGLAAVEALQPYAGALRVEGAEMHGGYAVVQPGDSGGAAYVGKDPQRIIVGVNSCGGTGCFNVKNPRTTVLTNLTYGETAKWVCDWIDEKDAHVCGINSTEGCRAR